MTPPTGIALFETAIGTCGLAWGERGLTAVALPGSSAQRPRARLVRAAPAAGEGEPPRGVREAIEGITALLAGEPRDLSGVELDLAAVARFDRRVTAVARTIAPGETLTYGEVAARIGAPGEAREVGKALGRNRFPIVVPCHRVVAANGRLGGFSAPGGAATKLRLLEIERAHADRSPTPFGDQLALGAELG
jgi:methylated-DNA-[protein]-cysteine S-methyltransferase